MPQVNSEDLANKPFADLERIRSELVAKARGNVDNLDDDDLRLMAAVTGVLRRKSSGPPKEPKAVKTPRVKKTPVALGDLA